MFDSVMGSTLSPHNVRELTNSNWLHTCEAIVSYAHYLSILDTHLGTGTASVCHVVAEEREHVRNHLVVTGVCVPLLTPSELETLVPRKHFLHVVVHAINDHCFEASLIQNRRHCWRMSERVNSPTASPGVSSVE